MITKSPSAILPNFDILYIVTRDFVKEHQGEKGYIDTDNWNKDNPDTYGNDTIYGFEYDEETKVGEERIVYGVRVRDDELQVLMRPWLYSCDNAPTEEEIADEDSWDCVKCGFNTYYIPTLYNIAECIEEYV